LALSEIELVEGAAPALALLPAELDPLGVLNALAGLDHETDSPALVRKAGVESGVAFAAALHARVAAEQKRRLRVQLDPVDRREQGDDGEGMRHQVGHHADVG